ncbi:MAG: aminodeoxychorismate synthase component I [Chthoniobacterales bacterium]
MPRLTKSETKKFIKQSRHSLPSPSSTPGLIPLGLSIKPADLAAHLQTHPGFAFLDSSHAGQTLSLLAHSPSKTFTGNLFKDQQLDNALATHQPAQSDSGIPFPDSAFIGSFDFDGTYHFGFYEKIFIFDHEKQTWWIPPTEKLSLLTAPNSPPDSPADFSLRLQPDISKNTWLKMLQRAQEYIAAGDIYQVCLAYPHQGRFTGNPWQLYKSWHQHSPAPHAAFINQNDRFILSTSPECFFHLTERRLLTRPIKGTRPRHPDHNEDRRLACELQSSVKENAELLMITDLERNDLGRICQFGSVEVSELIKLETFPHVFHLVSTVQGRLRDEVTPIEALRNCFPGGSISGAPKKRALEIIQELEPTPRGLFTGAIGYFGTNGDARFNIAIRTLTLEKNSSNTSMKAEYQTGAGIVADSHPEDEWAETHHKAAGLLSVLNE